MKKLIEFFKSLFKTTLKATSGDPLPPDPTHKPPGS